MKQTDNENNSIPDDAASQSPPEAPETPDVTKLAQERDDLFERLARATADFKNTQKRMEADTDQRLQFANSLLIKTLLPVIDNFERALNQDAEKVDSGTIIKGLQIVHDQLIAVLKQQKVDEIAPQPGDLFDPNLHQALMQQAGEYAEPTVTMLMQKGYSLHGRVLRPAQVAVSKMD